jgi:hypothetical protein
MEENLFEKTQEGQPMRMTGIVRVVGKEKTCCPRVAQLLVQYRGREFEVYLPPESPRQVRCRYCNTERTVQMYEFVHPIRRLGGRRAVWIETSVVELLPPLQPAIQPEESEAP